VIPEGTVLVPDAYLVVAEDADYLRGLHPGIPIVGDFSGRLSNSGETIVLEDALGNPVDQVRRHFQTHGIQRHDGQEHGGEKKDKSRQTQRQGSFNGVFPGGIKDAAAPGTTAFVSRRHMGFL